VLDVNGGQPRIKGGVWYYVITIASVGLLACVPFFHAASVLARRSLWKIGGAYAVASVVASTLMGAAPVDETDTPVGWMANLGGMILLIVIVAAVFQQRSLRREVYGPRAHFAGRLNPAIAAVESARARRRDARELAERDPLMARELCIGRPDLPRQYDDGGLVDLNAAPAAAIADVCQVPMAVAQELVTTRAHLGRFSSVEEAIVYANVPGDDVHGLRERAIVLPIPARGPESP
jgi:hypothetical protein